MVGAEPNVCFLFPVASRWFLFNLLATRTMAGSTLILS